MYSAVIDLSTKAYTPEAFAYAKHLEKRGVSVTLTSESVQRSNYDIGIRFLGFDPFWNKKNHDRARFEIHEYHSLSTPPHPKIKDLIKSTINSKPDARIFLNQQVKDRLKFISTTPYIFRGMGVDKEFYSVEEQKKEFHLLYSGSINGRPGLLEEIERLSKIGFKILIIGEPNNNLMQIALKHRNIKLIGRVERRYLPGLYKKCMAGINYTPNLYPYNIQDSTKTLEYCASGIGVISNRYDWIINFSKDRDAKFLWIEDITDVEQFESFQFVIPKLIDLEWETLLDSVGFYDFCMNGFRRI